MIQATQASTTRRALFAAPAVTLGAVALAHSANDDPFVEAIAVLHVDGREAARQALNAGLRPQDLYCVMLESGSGDAPVLLFQPPGAPIASVRPSGVE
jgi:hypothetical protein